MKSKNFNLPLTALLFVFAIVFDSKPALAYSHVAASCEAVGPESRAMKLFANSQGSNWLQFSTVKANGDLDRLVYCNLESVKVTEGRYVFTCSSSEHLQLSLTLDLRSSPASSPVFSAPGEFTLGETFTTTCSINSSALNDILTAAGIARP